jgi:FKBP-type peptidyl-prolyl cis-trans isomerase
VKNLNRSPKLRSRAGLGLAALATTALIAGCGSSSSSSTITVGNENKADEAFARSSASASSSTTTTPTTAGVKTPTSGPLSKEPTVTPAGAAPTSLVVKDIIKGTGPEAKAGQRVTVNYVGALFHGGKVFDASWKRNEPFVFTLGQSAVIKGWDQGIVGMKVGGRRELVIPASLAYKNKGAGAAIPPNSPLVFVVDLLGV